LDVVDGHSVFLEDVEGLVIYGDLRWGWGQEMG
jgi:hypothetical protein